MTYSDAQGELDPKISPGKRGPSQAQGGPVDSATHSPPIPDDVTILRQIAQMDMSGFDLFVDRYSQRLIDYINSRVRDYHTAENLAQEVFLRIFNATSKRQFNGDKSYLAQWIFTIANNCLIDHYRECVRKPVTLDSDTMSDNQEVGTIANCAAQESDPSHAAMQNEQRETVYDALDQLSEPQREVIRLKVLGGLTFAQTAQMLDCPLATVKSRMRYALQLLAACRQFLDIPEEPSAFCGVY